MNRRQLMRSALSVALAHFAAACTLQRSGAGVRRVRLQADPFALGVASGEPATDGFVIWTRLMGMAAPLVEVAFEIAEDDAFRRVVRRDRVTATAGFGHAVHVLVEGLRSGRDYWYRFQCGEAVSRSGRARTIALRPQRMRAALTSCQHWEHGFFSAYADMIERDVDVVLQVGDYIYESSFGAGPNVRQFPAPTPRTLDEYRARHALYRQDTHLQNAHASMPFVVAWDDHEVQNDYAATQSALGLDPLTFQGIRAAAYQAYFEHLPLRPGSLLGTGEVQLFRRLSWPGLATFHVLDTRQYRAVQPCSTDTQRRGRRIARCAEVDAPSRSMLGAPQERWLQAGLAAESARWSVLTQQTLFSPMKLPEQTLWSDFWDAYPVSRDRATAALRQPSVQNALILGGDLHSFWVNDVHQDANDPRSPVLATELLTSCLAARNGPDELFAQVSALNPHVRFLDNQHSGYVLLDITPEQVSADLRAVAQLSDPHSAVHSLRSFLIEAQRSAVG